MSKPILIVRPLRALYVVGLALVAYKVLGWIGVLFVGLASTDLEPK